MNIGGVLLLRFIGSLEESAAAQAAYAVGYTELFSLITWTSVGLMGASATIAGQNLGAGNPDRAVAGVRVASRFGLAVAAFIGAMFLLIPTYLLAVFGMTEPLVLSLGKELLSYCVSGSSSRVPHYNRRPSWNWRHAQPAYSRSCLRLLCLLVVHHLQASLLKRANLVGSARPRARHTQFAGFDIRVANIAVT